MAVLNIKKYPDKILNKKASPIININNELQKLIDDMIETMYAAPGIGLAAPQVGVSKQLIVIDVSTKEENVPLLVLINPEIIEQSGTVESNEGCLSIPGFETLIKRAERLLVRGLNREGNPVEIEATGLLATALQHEIDHLNGVLIIDRISPIKREFFKKRLKKNLKRSNDS